VIKHFDFHQLPCGGLRCKRGGGGTPQKKARQTFWRPEKFVLQSERGFPEHALCEIDPNPKTCMISNERPSPYYNHSYSVGNPPPRVVEGILKSESLQVERKSFTLQLRENPRGRLLRINEEVQGRRNTIIIPSTGLEEFRRVFAEMAKAAADLPEKRLPSMG